MARITVTVISNRLTGQFQGQIRRAVSQVVRETVEEIATDAKQRAPVDTGRLRSSIHAQMQGDLTGVVGTNVEYALYVERGTHAMPAQPYLTPAAERAAPKFVGAIRTALKELG